MNIKIITLLSAGLVISGSVMGQKAKVVTAYNYNKAFERDKDCKDLVKGIEAISPAVKDEKTKSWAKTWYYGGNLYFNAALTKDKECSAKFPDAIEKTLHYYINALKYNIKDEGAHSLDLDKQADQQKLMGYLMNKETQFDDPSYTRIILVNKFPYLANAVLNKGVEAFNEKNYKQAKTLYEKSIMINAIMGRVDSLGMYNAAIASEKMENYDDALAYYGVLSQINYGGANMYLYMANIYDHKKDTTNKIKIIKKGLEKYPDDAGLIREQLSYLLATGKTDEALGNFDKAIEKDPKDPSLYYNRGLIYDQMGDVEKAAKDYNKALEVDPTYFDAAYNLGAMYFNEGAERNNEASSYGIDEQSKYEAATQKAKAAFAKAKPALEKAHEINPKDKSTMASLVKVYAILGETDNYNKMKKELGQ